METSSSQPHRHEPATQAAREHVYTASDQPLGAGLELALRQQTQQQLGPVSWFRTDWQRGGALTGYAEYQTQQGAQQVVVKLPVPPRERHWLMQLQAVDGLVPQLYASGETLGGYDMVWLIMERLPHGPLGGAWAGKEFDLMIEAAARFYHASQTIAHHGSPEQRDWHALFDQARANLRDHDFAHEQKWKNALKKAHKKLKDWLHIWHQRPCDHWCFGDLHLANALSRQPAPHGPAVLIDFANVRLGHWIEDAIFFEHLYWARRQRLGERQLCHQLAHHRKRLGLPVDSDWPRLASIRRVLLAIASAAQLDFDGDPHHIAASLQVLENEL